MVCYSRKTKTKNLQHPRDPQGININHRARDAMNTWTPQEVEETIINGLKAGKISVQCPLQALQGSDKAAWPTIHMTNAEMRQTLYGRNTEHDTAKDMSSRNQVKGVRFHAQQHHIDQFPDVIAWMFLIPEVSDRLLFQVIIDQKMQGLRQIDAGAIRDRFYNGGQYRKCGAPADKIRYDYRNILSSLTTELNVAEYPKRNVQEFN